MNGNFDNGVFNSTLIETDLDGNLVNDGEMPFWLRDIIERAFSASGIRVNRRVASKDAIASLHVVELVDSTGGSCPICYDPYVFTKDKKMKINPEELPEELANRSSALDQLACSVAPVGVSVATEKENMLFSDPSLFFPVDPAASYSVRYPVSNLHTRVRVTHAEMFPTLKLEASVTSDGSSCEHIPVSMPHCGHVFGKPCIVEWLNGNVSCPLCRKEVEALKDSDPLSKKISTIKKNCNFVFTVDSDLLIMHLAKHLTDVFNPSRKTMNPSVTPLTDTYVPQEWATSSHPSLGVPGASSGSIDPPLIMTRKFPLSRFGRDSSALPSVSMVSLSSANRPLQPTNTLTHYPSANEARRGN